jgi:uncharacterized membrane-anchored protein
VFTTLWLCLKIDEKRKPGLYNSWKEKLVHLDIFGTALFSTSLICLLSGLQLIGDQGSSIASLVVLFITTTVAALALAIQQKFRDAEGLIPKNIIQKRNVWAVAGLFTFSFAALANQVYFLPSYLQVSAATLSKLWKTLTLPN